MQSSRTITRTQFEQWVNRAFNSSKNPSIRKIAKVGDISKSRLSYQLNANDVDPQFIISISRGLNVDPRKELGQFAGYGVLVKDPQRPLANEILTLVSLRDLIAEIARRYHLVLEQKPLDPPIKEVSWSAWFKTVAPSTTYAQLKDVTGLSQTVISKNQQTAGWSIQQLLNIAEHFNLNPHLTLVASGYLSLTEAGYRSELREDTLSTADNMLLQEQLEKRAPTLTHNIKLQHEDDTRNAVIEHMG